MLRIVSIVSIVMSHFSQTALPPQNNSSSVMNEHPSPPTKRGMSMANAFIQIFKYHQGKYKSCIYSSKSSVYYTIFLDNYSDSVCTINHFIEKNKHLLIDFLTSQYSEEYQVTEYFTYKLSEWNKCKLSEIVYALSTEHSNCLQTLELYNSKSRNYYTNAGTGETTWTKPTDGGGAAAASGGGLAAGWVEKLPKEKLFMWVTHMEDYSSCDPCEPREHSTTNTLKVHNSISGSTPAQPTPADTWTYYHDGCMGGGDF